MVFATTLVLSPIIWLAGDRPLAIVMALVAGLGAAIMAVVLGMIYRANGAPARAALYYPRGCWIVAGAMLEGASDLEQRKPVRWGGREYVLEPQD
jgi:hypothetical protein